MRTRIIIGSIATVLFIKQFITISIFYIDYSFNYLIDKLQFPYPYISQTNRLNASSNPFQKQFLQNTYILSIKNLHQITNNFPQLQQNDLVLCQNANGQYVFKIVGAVNRTYSSYQHGGFSHYIPQGFVFLVDPIKKEVGMESLAVVCSKKHFSMGKWNKQQKNAIQNSQNKQNAASINEQKSLQRQILQRNNILERIQQIKKKKTNQSI